MKQNNIQMIKQIKISLSSITIYRNILDDDIIMNYSNLLDILEKEQPVLEEILDSYHRLLSSLIHKYAAEQFDGDLWQYHIIKLLLADENIFSLSCEKGTNKGLSRGLLDIVSKDLQHIQKIFRFNGQAIQELICSKIPELFLPSWNISLEHTPLPDIVHALTNSKDWCMEMEKLIEYYDNFGCGDLSKYKAFYWDQKNYMGSLLGVQNPDPIKLNDLIGYVKQRQEVIANTLQFINGLPCNNLLLYGDRGTGKSATVKALLNEYSDYKLRLIEISKYHLKDLPQLMENIEDRGMKFIIFIDDLSFESDETSYRELKSILEGGIGVKPENIIIYATSNRRHLIKEYFSERCTNDEVSSGDTLQEKLSLSDRFGMTITFSSPDKDEYLRIVEGLAEQRGLDISPEQLKIEALKWEMWYNGRSPRTARQFIDHLEGKLKLSL